MQLLIVRHAFAGDRESFSKTGRPDSERPLTKEGRDKFKKAAKGLSELVERIDVIATSPFARASQTADLLAKVFKKARVVHVSELAQGRRPEEALKALAALSQENVVAAVGHEPGLGRLISLLCSAGGTRLKLRKGGACLLECGPKPRAAAASMQWLVTADQLRKLA